MPVRRLRLRRPGPWNLASLYALFPILNEKRRQPATSLSGGQQQMVALGRALIGLGKPADAKPILTAGIEAALSGR